MQVRDLTHRIEESELFDSEWYVRRYQDVQALNLSPAEHYVRIGVRLLRDPGPQFSTRFYLVTHPDVASAGVNPLWHYIIHGRNEGRRIAPSGYNLPSPAPDHPVPLFDAPPPRARPARLIAFYLPQFHPIPENDGWWGEGFTEWTNVRPATPQFTRHYQPHVPGELGYYDLRDTAIQRRQIELARLYGIEGFCFYFYWFAGKRLLETPLLNYLEDRSLDLPFCLSWANENWSRRWDGREHDVLMAQDHSPDDDLAFIAHVAKYLCDPRYIRVEGKPLLLVYRPSLLPDPAATAGRWREWCRENGLGEIYIAYTQSFESNDPGEYGFDAAIEFPPNNSGVPRINKHYPTKPGFKGNIFDWSALVERSFAYPPKPYTLFRGLCPSWDNTARRGANGTILANSSPERFTRWATNAIRDTKVRFNPDERLVFVNAWNEWAEGAHLEPDQRHGYAWLESIRVALACNEDATPLSPDGSRMAIAIDALTPCGLAGVIGLCRLLPERHKLFVATATEHAEEVHALLRRSGREYFVHVAQRDTRDEVALLGLLPLLREEGFALTIVLRTDTSPEGADPADAPQAARELLDPAFLEQALARFAADARLGMLCPESERLPSSTETARGLPCIGGRLGLCAEEVADHGIWRGNAFIARTNTLAPMESLSFQDAEFRPGSRYFDPNLADAIDQAFPLSPIAAGLHVVGTQESSAVSGRRRVVIVSHDAHPHGAQLLALNMARTYGQMGFDVDMIVLGPGKLLERFAEVATVHRIDLASQLPSTVLRLLRAMHATGARFAIANTTVSGLLVPLLRQAGLKTISLIHELPGILESYQLQAHAQAIVGHADSVVFPAGIVKRGFENFVGQQVRQALIRPQGLYLRNPHRTRPEREDMRRQIRRSLGLAEDASIILCVGYADHRKGLDLFADACCRVMVERPKTVAVWVGHADRALLTEVQESIRQAELEDRFVFTDLVDNPQDYFAAADAYALTSREDPFPSVVLEALDASVPVVSFAGVVGSEEVLERGTGLLVPAFDTDAMAEALGTLLDDREFSTSLGDRGREIVENEFDFRHYMFDLAQLGGLQLHKVSVIVPNYNYARYIEERLASIQRQTSPIYELIVLDDASTDNSVEIITDFLSGISLSARLVASDENSGSVFKQWLRGVELARGDFVWIAEADDLADPEFLEELLPAFSDPDVVMSYSQSRQMDGDGKIMCEHYLDYVSDLDRVRWTKPYVASGREEISKALFVKNTIPNVSGVVFRREALREVLDGSQDEIFSYRNAGDWVVYLRLLERGSIAYCPRPLNSHRRHQGSVTIGGFNLTQLQEIVRVQTDTISRHELGQPATSRADDYAQKLYEQFGLATTTYPHFRDHPQIKTLCGSRTSEPEIPTDLPSRTVT